MKKITAVLAGAVPLLIAATQGPAAAAASADGDGVPTLPNTVVSGTVDTTHPHASIPASADSGISAQLNADLVALQSADAAGQIVSTKLDRGTGVVTVYAYGDTAGLEKIASSAKTARSIAFEPTAYSKAQLDAEALRILQEHPTVPGGRISVIGPQTDGSGLRVEVTSDPTALRGTSLDDTLASEVPLQIVYGDDVTPVDRWSPSAPYVSGTVMTRTAGENWSRCTTGFWIVNTEIAPFERMLTAAHCGTGTSNTWYAGSSPSGTSVGTGIGTGTGGDYGLLSTGSLSRAAYVYWGAYNTNTVAPIRGYTAYPAVDSGVCYSGSYSGTVCGNLVTATGQFICYSITQCYANMVITHQSADVPAVGNGDSGGPVIGVSGGEAYAAGVISGMQNAGASCTGMPADDYRDCSATAIYSTVYTFLANNAYHAIYVVPIV